MSSQGEVRDGHAAGFRLIETLGWRPGVGFVRLERHLARLAASAGALGFDWSETAGLDRLREAVATAGAEGKAGPLRVRLELFRDGAVMVAATPFALLAPDAEWRIRIAATRLDPQDPLRAHKTTERDAFDAARAEFSRRDADEVILLNMRGEVCEGTITSVFVDAGAAGRLRTPALSCGVLPGVLRGELIASGRAVEAVLTVADLHRARAVFVGNSLRGLIAARLA